MLTLAANARRLERFLLLAQINQAAHLDTGGSRSSKSSFESILNGRFVSYSHTSALVAAIRPSTITLCISFTDFTALYSRKAQLVPLICINQRHQNQD